MEAALITVLLSLLMMTWFLISSLLLKKKIDEDPFANNVLFLDPAICRANGFVASSLISAGTIQS